MFLNGLQDAIRVLKHARFSSTDPKVVLSNWLWIDYTLYEKLLLHMLSLEVLIKLLRSCSKLKWAAIHSVFWINPGLEAQLLLYALLDTFCIVFYNCLYPLLVSWCEIKWSIWITLKNISVHRKGSSSSVLCDCLMPIPYMSPHLWVVRPAPQGWSTVEKRTSTYLRLYIVFLFVYKIIFISF